MNCKIPQSKEVRPINFIFHRAEVTLADLIHQVPIAKALIKEAAKLDLHPTGPVHWHYVGFTGATKPFTLEICLPVASIPADYDGLFHFKRTGDFKSVSLLHEGSWETIPESYAQISQFNHEHNFEEIGLTRELYINVDFADPRANVTEIQMGIK